MHQLQIKLTFAFHATPVAIIALASPLLASSAPQAIICITKFVPTAAQLIFLHQTLRVLANA